MSHRPDRGPKRFKTAKEGVDAIRDGLGQFEGLFGGQHGGLGSLIDTIGKLAEQGEAIQRQGSFGKDEGVSGVFGLKVKVGINGLESEVFGDLSDDEGPAVDPVRTPLVDLFEDPEMTRIIAELPGVDAGEVEVLAHPQSVEIKTAGRRVYAKTIELTRAVEPASLTHELVNGILDIQLKPVD